MKTHTLCLAAVGLMLFVESAISQGGIGGLAHSVEAPCDSPPRTDAPSGSGTKTRLRGNVCRYEWVERVREVGQTAASIGQPSGSTKSVAQPNAEVAKDSRLRSVDAPCDAPPPVDMPAGSGSKTRLRNNECRYQWRERLRGIGQATQSTAPPR